jgi:hypothetical protein
MRYVAPFHQRWLAHRTWRPCRPDGQSAANSILLIGLLLLAGVAVSTVASLLRARGITRPIFELQRGAADIGTVRLKSSALAFAGNARDGATSRGAPTSSSNETTMRRTAHRIAAVKRVNLIDEWQADKRSDNRAGRPSEHECE